MPVYLFRLDDITDSIDMERFNRCLNLFAQYHIKPILGIIPDNRDPSLKKYPVHTGFWINYMSALNQCARQRGPPRRR